MTNSDPSLGQRNGNIRSPAAMRTKDESWATYSARRCFGSLRAFASSENITPAISRISHRRDIGNVKAYQRLVDCTPSHFLPDAIDNCWSAQHEGDSQGDTEWHLLVLQISQLKYFGRVFIRNTLSSIIARERMIVTDTGCDNILVEGNCAASVSRKVYAAIDALTSGWPHCLEVRRS